MVLERKTHDRLLHLAKRCKIYHDMFCTAFATEEDPFRAETFCQVKQSTTCVTLKNHQIPMTLKDSTASFAIALCCINLYLFG